MSKTLKALMRKTSGYAVYDSDENSLIGIIQCSTDDESENVDITERVRTMIQEHFVADSVNLHSLPDGVLHPDMNGEKKFGASLEEDGEDTERSFEICTVAVY